jgi:hypothetical protein
MKNCSQSGKGEFFSSPHTTKHAGPLRQAQDMHTRLFPEAAER